MHDQGVTDKGGVERAARVRLRVLEDAPLAVWAYNTHLAVRSEVHNMRNCAQMRLDMRKHATAREIARRCTLGGGVEGVAG